MNAGNIKMHEPDSAERDEVMSNHIAGLRYAGMIQHALMPNPEAMKGYLNDFFVFFLPRDIVSGDFYYAFCNRKIMCLAVGDCTGHGVPGALMSILGISILNEILQSSANLKANRVLNLMREKVMKALNQTGTSTETKDSIDIGLCLIDCCTGQIQYSGANRPLILVRDGVLTEFKADKMTIGVAPLKETPFTNISIDTISGDRFYLFSDGYADQFGEVTNKKLKHKQFRKIIESAQVYPMNEQTEIMKKAYFEWKGSVEQIDDVLVFGFQIK
jgi:serine phosphatase RsbU (regulator of sigma subunit)